MGSIGFASDLEFYMAVLKVVSGLIGWVASVRFKTLDSQPVKSHMDTVPTDVHEY